MSTKQIRNRVAVLLIEDNKILLVQHEKYGKRYWLLPGGGVDFGETLEECAIREVKEETGLDIRIGDLLWISESIPTDQHRHVINYYYPGRIMGGDMEMEKDTIIKDLQWHLIEDLPHLVVYPDISREIVEWYRSQNVPKISIGNRWNQ